MQSHTNYTERKTNFRPAFNSQFINNQREFRETRGQEARLLPNEMRVSTRGDYKNYVESALRIVKNGYDFLKIVGRGEAVVITEDLLEELKARLKYSKFLVHYTQALNKKGVVVNEIHIMVS